MWKSRVLCEISKLRWKSFCDFHRSDISTAVYASPSLTPSWAVPYRQKAPRFSVDASKFEVHEAHKPVAAFGFRQSDRLASHGCADKDQVAVPLNNAIVPDLAHLVRRVIGRL